MCTAPQRSHDRLVIHGAAAAANELDQRTISTSVVKMFYKVSTFILITY